MAKVFILVRWATYDGHSAPYQAFHNEAEARAAQRLANAGFDSAWKLYAVPIWPEPAAERDFDMRPLPENGVELA